MDKTDGFPNFLHDYSYDDFFNKFEDEFSEEIIEDYPDEFDFEGIASVNECTGMVPRGEDFEGD